MPKQNVSLLAFNRGIVSPLALARTDIDRLSLSAEMQTNWMPRTLGSMMLRPGSQYIAATRSNAKAECIPFIFSTTDSAIIEIADSVMRVYVNDALISRDYVTSAITNGTFDSDISGWTDDDDAGATSAWATGGYLSLTGTGFNSAIVYQEVTVGLLSQNKNHAIRVSVERGPVRLRVGTSAGDDSYVSETLKTGVHSLKFVPAGNFFVELSSANKYAVLVDSVVVEGAGTMELPVPWGESDLPNLRWDQSADVVFIACAGYKQRRIERRATESWSVVEYEPEDGPFFTYNQGDVRLTPSAISGDITVTASRAFFKSGHDGALFRIDSVGQKVEVSITGEDQFSDEIRVTGVDSTRGFTITRSGTWTATITLQRSVAEPGAWVDVTTYTTNGSVVYNDALDNQVIYYRIGVKAGDFTSGTADVSLEFSGGSRTGIFKITEVLSATYVSARVIIDLGGTDASSAWAEGMWSDYRGYPTAVALYEGRLWWAGKDRIWGSVSDEYESFDDEVSGDSGPIIRAIGAGPVDVINWLLPLQRLIVGTDGAEKSARSTSYDEPLTPTNINLKDASTQGSSFVAPVKIDSRGVFIQRSGSRAYMMGYDLSTYDYQTTDLGVLAPEIGRPGIVKIVVQRQPDTRIHCIRSDGKVAIHVFDAVENVSCWVLYETSGAVETAVVLPGAEEDAVYYVVRREINGNTVRYLEKFAKESECVGGATNKLVDSFWYYNDSDFPTTSLNADHLKGETVSVWGNSKYLGDYVVDTVTGLVTIGEEVTEAYLGLKYHARYRSSKLAYASGLGTALAQRKKLNQLGLILANCHASGVKYGPDFDTLDDLPAVENGTGVDEDYIHESYDEDMFEFNGEWDTDSRLCLYAEAPKPCTVLAAIMSIQTNDKG